MSRTAFAIPEKIFFKIGEVCDLVGVQPHVLRYWETEFPMLSPQKNRAGQRTYRRRDVEIAVRIKELLYEDLYTIAGAKKKLSSELREATARKFTVVPPAIEQPKPEPAIEVPAAFAPAFPVVNPNFETDDDFIEDDESSINYEQTGEITPERQEALRNLAVQLNELLELLDRRAEEQPRRW